MNSALPTTARVRPPVVPRAVPAVEAPPPRNAAPSLELARARRFRQGGRSVLLWALVWYAVAQGALLLVVHSWHPTLTEAWWDHKWPQLQQAVAREPDRPLMLMLGSSRADDAFQADRFDGLPGPGGKPYLAYNFGVPMAGPIHHQLYLDEMLKVGIRPSLLLVEFLPPLLGQTHNHNISEENWTLAPCLSLSELRRLSPYFEHPNHKVGDWLEGRLAPWYTFRASLCNLVYERVSGATDLPADRRADPWSYWVHDGRGYRLPKAFTATELAVSRHATRGAFTGSLARLRVGEGPSRAMRDLLDRCKREQIRVVLVLMPESSEFRSWYCPEGLAQTRRLWADCCAEYGAHGVDATGWVADADFRDGHHVEPEGARVFSTRLLEELRPVIGQSRER